MLDIKSLANLSKEAAVAAAKKRYATPALKMYGAVSELTNGSTGSIGDGHGSKTGSKG